MAKQMNVPFLGRVSIDPKIVDSADEGTPFVLSQPGSESVSACEDSMLKILASV